MLLHSFVGIKVFLLFSKSFMGIVKNVLKQGLHTLNSLKPLLTAYLFVKHIELNNIT